MDRTEELFEILRRICALTFSSKGIVWTGNGIGNVVAATIKTDVVTFSETGTWQDNNGRKFRFNNVFQWSIVGTERVRLDHLRNGADRPVELFELSPIGDTWQSIRPHV